MSAGIPAAGFYISGCNLVPRLTSSVGASSVLLQLARSTSLFAHYAGETSQLTRRVFAAVQTPSNILTEGRRARRRPVARTPTAVTTTSATARPKVHRKVVDDANIQGTRSVSFYHFTLIVGCYRHSTSAMAKVDI
ncbi:hypothetical protein M422DRAFT_277101 [Sphaerobolus stellatus SS14]|uniref:Uncharacterized protein n=1 Tax=Sphaerobolus stellatus (strain SS14) TaxID=990650 RepID=A0A0C9U0J1_SPHS4|nr:hypothetical protein M422DRAFT_277101 [Sphaerobolus stellatus SS14]